MREEKLNDAKAIFELAITLYPKAFNAFDSYGECLLKMELKEEGITAYKRSLELNPKNESAIKALEEMK